VTVSPAAAPGTTSAPAPPDAGAGTALAGLPASCRYNGALPDPACTPGAVDPAVTQANIETTICVRGYTARVRPPTTYTGPLKTALMARYGATGPAAQYELDHLVPLEVGGAPRSVQNLWPEPLTAHPGSMEKDHLENYLHDQICAGRVLLADAQHAVAANWLQTWDQAGRP
jgi:hypothetical protein